jgi:hypothetical protein
VDYTVRFTHEIQSQARFQVLASVDGKPVARGTMTARVGLKIPTAITEG